MRIERDAVGEAKRILAAEGCLVVESLPKAGLTVFLAQLRDAHAEEHGAQTRYINCALPGFSLRQALKFQLGISQAPYPGLLAEMQGARPLLILIDRPDLAPEDEYRELMAFLHTLSGERLFCPTLANSGLVIGICGTGTFHAACRLSYFTRGEVAALPGCQDENTAAEVHYWSGGSPAVAAEICRHLPQTLREGSEKHVYRALLTSAEGGRLGRMARQDLSQLELVRLGLTLPDSRGLPIPLPAYTALRSRILEAANELVISRKTHEARFKGRLLPLFPRESRILHLLAERPGQVFSPTQIYRHISTDALDFPGDESVKTHLSRLRRKLPPGVDWIITRRGLGYSFSPMAPLRLVD